MTPKATNAFLPRQLMTFFILLTIMVLSTSPSYSLTHFRRARHQSQSNDSLLGSNIKCEYCSNTLSTKARTQTHSGENKLLFPKQSFICNNHWCEAHNQPRPDRKACAMCKAEKRRAREKLAELRNRPKKPLNGFLGIKFGDIASETRFKNLSTKLFEDRSSNITTSTSFEPKKRFRTYTAYWAYFLPLSKRIYKIECSFPLATIGKLTDEQEREIQISIIEKRFEGKMKYGPYKTGTMHFSGTGPRGRKLSLDVMTLTAVDLDLQALLDEEIAAVRKLRQRNAINNIKQEDIDAL